MRKPAPHPICTLIILAAALTGAIATGCRSWTEADIPGTYRGKMANGNAILVLSPDGTYSEEFSFTSRTQGVAIEDGGTPTRVVRTLPAEVP